MTTCAGGFSPVPADGFALIRWLVGLLGCRAKIIAPAYAALARLKWFVGKEDTLRELLLEVIRSTDFPVFLLPEWYTPQTNISFSSSYPPANLF
jgi:hypothetical protein